MTNEALAIQDVSDTALWVAYYRSLETDRAKPLFQDAFAKLLIGDRGQQIAESLEETSPYVEFNVLIRTVIIDRYIQELAAGKVDCIVNLGAGLDTRPYRLKLPAQLQWIEVDYPHMIALKDQKLAAERPSCLLRRVSLDLNDRVERTAFLREVAREYKNVVVLTEGVLPYLTEDQVATLSEDLIALPEFKFWIADYISSVVYKYLRGGRRAEKMKNAPFQFYPQDWTGFFQTRGWNLKEMRYLPEEGKKLGRSMPTPLIARLLAPLMSQSTRARFMRSSGYMVLERAI